ncbi:hypothetical protein HDU97_001674 [Phlyctochytrium planicorne]|nr:hypothetical protein HDU97_001674 [Phlyctochytrium planicorne]
MNVSDIILGGLNATLNATLDGALNGTDEDTGLDDVEVEEPEGWFDKIAIKYVAAINGISLALTIIALIKFGFCRYHNPKFFERMSLKLITCFLVACVGFHAAFIYSLYYQDDQNCKASTFLYTFFSMVHCFLTTGLGVNLFLIFVMKQQVPDSNFYLYWVVAIVASLAFSIPPIIMNVISYFDVDGCWFSSVKWSWIFYYGPLFTMAVVNIVLGGLVQFALTAHRKQMDGAEHGDSSHEASSANDTSGAASSHMSSKTGRSTHGMTAVEEGKSSSNIVSPSSSKPKKPKKTGDSLRSVAKQVNYYVAIPFICEIATAVTESIPGNGGNVGDFFQTTLVSSMGILTFIVILFDPTVQKSLKEAFKAK